MEVKAGLAESGGPLPAVSSRAPGIALDRRGFLRGSVALPLSATGLAGLASQAHAADSPTALVLAPGLTVLFHEAGESGAVAFGSEDGRRAVVSDFERVKTAYPPASTFKIPNTVIALETGVVASLDDPVFTWDGEVRTIDGKPVEAWNRDQTLREAFRNSTVWVYQEIARKVGAESMARLVQAFDYGNRAIGEIDRFWLSGPLRISALEQIAFLHKLSTRTLPVSERAQTLAVEAMEIERTDGHVLRGKTGWAFDEKIGWFVGWVETQSPPHPFALNLDVVGPNSLAARTRIATTAARQLGYM